MQKKLSILIVVTIICFGLTIFFGIKSYHSITNVNNQHRICTSQETSQPLDIQCPALPIDWVPLITFVVIFSLSINLLIISIYKAKNNSFTGKIKLLFIISLIGLIISFYYWSKAIKFLNTLHSSQFIPANLNYYDIYLVVIFSILALLFLFIDLNVNQKNIKLTSKHRG